MKIKSIKWYRRENDKLLRQICFERDEEKCILCGNPAQAPHHWYITKGAGGYSVRWIINNIISVCISHHHLAHGIKGGGSPGKFIYLMEQKITAGKYKKLVETIEKEMAENHELIMRVGVLGFCRREWERLTEIKKLVR